MDENINNYSLSNDNTYTAEDIMNILRIGKTAAYDLIKDSLSNKKNFKVIKIGKQYRIPKQSFNEWFKS